MSAQRLPQKTRPAVSALDRARQVWRGVASITRAEARTRGVRGELRQLDEVASGHRGSAAPRGLHMLAQEMRAAGVPREEAIERITEAARLIANLTYFDAPPAA